MPKTQITGTQVRDKTIGVADILPAGPDQILRTTPDSTAVEWIPNPMHNASNTGDLPSSPSTGDTSFYEPFNSPVMWDGSHWISAKVAIPLFGKKGRAQSDAWLDGMADTPLYPQSGLALGYHVPLIGTGSGFKIYGLSVTNRNLITGDMELHANSTLSIPVYASTGIAKVTLTNEIFKDGTFSGALINSGSKIQCFWRRASDQWQEFSVIITYSLVVL